LIFFEYPTGRRRDIPPSPPLLSKHVDQRRSSVGEHKAEGAKSRQHPIYSTFITKLYLIGDRSSIYVSQPSRPDRAL
jgi:hypothetical protein